MFGKMKEDLNNLFEELKTQGLYKRERVIISPQGSVIKTAGAEPGPAGGTEVLNFCSNNYLGLANNREVIEAACKAMEEWGYGLSSVRFICGTQKIHKDLEEAAARFLGMEDSILYAACFDANGGLFEPLLGEEDALISDELNHASIIDGVRLCKAKRFRYKHGDLKDLEGILKETRDCRYRLIATDGVFSMDGDIAPLKGICDLAEKYDSLVMVDDSHATGYIGPNGRGTPEHWGVTDRVDIITTTFGKALGGASGGCTAGRREIIQLLRQRSRPYLFSNTLPPAVAGATLKVLELLKGSGDLRAKVMANAELFKGRMKELGFSIVPGETAIVPVMLYDENTAVAMADRLLKKGIYVIGFVYPVVPKGKARIRVQLSAAHTREQIETAAAAFGEVGRGIGVIK